MGGTLDIARKERHKAEDRAAGDVNMTNTLIITIVALFAAVAAVAQSEHVSDKKIGPGSYNQIQRLVISGDKTVQMQPGQERQFRLLSSVMGRAGMYREVEAPATWSVTKMEGLAVDGKGKLTVAAGVKHGATFRLTAKALIKEPWEEKGYEVTVEQDVIVFDPKENPLVGDWTQNSATTCEGQKFDVDGRTGLRSLEFRADGTYSAAVAPFEAYRDYWGTYSFDPAKRTIKLTLAGGNNTGSIPQTSQGTYSVKDGVLTLTGMQLHPDPQSPKLCKAQFTK
jgi:hypothetical protein